MKLQGSKAILSHVWILWTWKDHNYQDKAEAKSKLSLMPCESLQEPSCNLSLALK